MPSVMMKPEKCELKKTERLGSLTTLTLLPWLQPQVAALIASEDFGKKKAVLDEQSLRSSAPMVERIARLNNVADKFLIAIPYAEDYIHCHVSFSYVKPDSFPQILVLKRRPLAGEDLEELEDLEFVPRFGNEPNSSEHYKKYRPQVFDFKRTTALLKLFISLTDEFCDYQRRKMYKHPLLKDEVDAINRDKISGAVEYRIYEEGEMAGRVVIVATLEPEIQGSNSNEMDIEVLIRMENFGERTGVRIKVVLCDELKNLLGSYSPPKFNVPLLPYLQFLQTQIDQRLKRLLTASHSISEDSAVDDLGTKLSATPIAD